MKKFVDLKNTFVHVDGKNIFFSRIYAQSNEFQTVKESWMELLNARLCALSNKAYFACLDLEQLPLALQENAFKENHKRLQALIKKIQVVKDMLSVLNRIDPIYENEEQKERLKVERYKLRNMRLKQQIR